MQGRFQRLRERKLLQWGIAYAAAAWLLLQIIDFLAETFAWSTLPARVATVLVAVGFLAVLVIAWYHGEKGRQRVSGVEAVILIGLLLIAGAVVAVVRANASAERAEPAAAPFDEVEEPVGLSALAPEPTRIAILYFDDLSEEQDLEYMASGFTETLIHELGQIDSVEVISRNGVRPFKDSEVTVDSIVRALRVGTLVEGSLYRTVGDSVRVNVRLIDSATNAPFASTELQRPWNEQLSLLDDVGEEIVVFLRQRLGTELQSRRLMIGTENLEAWTLVEQADQLVRDAHDLGISRETNAAVRILSAADSLYRRAERLDPSWVTPMLGRAEVAFARARLRGEAPEAADRSWLRVGVDHADRALAREPGNAEALEWRGRIRRYLAASGSAGEAREAQEEAEWDLRAAVAADPSRALAWAALADFLANDGRSAEAKVAAERALEADVFLTNADAVTFTIAHISLELEEFEEAARWIDEGRRRFPNDPAFVAAQLTLFAGSAGTRPSVDEVWGLANALTDAYPPEMEPYWRLMAAAALARSGLSDSAEAVIASATEQATGDPFVDYYEANARLMLEQREEALALLGSYLEAQPQRRQYIANDWWFRPLRDDPRFLNLVQPDGP